MLALSFVPLFFATSLWPALPAGVLLGAGWSGMLATNDLVIARVLDHDARSYGQHREGLFLSAFGVLGRLNGALSGLALASLGVFFGYYSGADPGENPGLAFRVYLCGYPFLLATAGAVLARFIQVPQDTPHSVPGDTPGGLPATGNPAAPPAGGPPPG